MARSHRFQGPDGLSRAHVLLVATLAVASTAGCVTRGSYDELDAQRADLEQRNAMLTSELDEARTENQQLSATLAAKKRELDSMVATRDRLVTELKDELAAGQIQIRKLVDGVSLNVSDELLFPSGGVEIDAKGRDVLQRVGQRIQGDTSLVFVEGHTDDVRIGPSLRSRFPTNWELAAARASVVVRILSEAGVDPKRLRAVSRGPFAPVVSNDTPEGRAKNRRTEIILRSLPKG